MSADVNKDSDMNTNGSNIDNASENINADASENIDSNTNESERQDNDINQSNIHVLYLSRVASYQKEENTDNQTLVMGFFDNISEVYQRNGKGGTEVDYLSAFGIHTPVSFTDQSLTAKQLFTLIEYKDPLLCHYVYDFDEYRWKSKQPTPNFKNSILDSKIRYYNGDDGSIASELKELDSKIRYYNGDDDDELSELEKQREKLKEKISHHPAFIGVVSANLNYFKEEKSIDTRMAEIKEKLERFINNARTDDYKSRNAGEISYDCEVRLFQCANCSDLCLTVSTYRLMDILLVSKAVQICIGERASAQFSPVWSFVTIPTQSLKKKNEPDSNKYIKFLVDSNSYREEPNEHREPSSFTKEAITVDFRVSFNDFQSEKEFLKKLKDAKELENALKDPSDQHEVDMQSKAAGVLGNGNYSVHLPFHEYLEVFRFKYLNKRDVYGGIEKLKANQPLLYFLLQKVTGKVNPVEETSENVSKVDISYQRIRFCYPKHLYDEDSRFYTAAIDINADLFEDENTSSAQIDTATYRDYIERMIQNMLNKISIYRNRITAKEYRFREAIYLAKDLVYTYNDLFARNNIHTITFATQLYAMLSNTNLFCEALMDEELDKETKRSRITEVTENLRMASLALDRYNHEIVMNSGSNFNVQNYELQSKVNIEKYVVAYSYFLQKICNAYVEKFHGEKNSTFPRLYPFVYLDLNKKRIEKITLFEGLKYENERTKRPDSPIMMAIAVPNYRRFANIARILPQLIHEVAHQFVYTEDHKEENEFLLKSGAAYVADLFVQALCRNTNEADLTYSEKYIWRIYQQSLIEKMTRALEKNILSWVDDEDLRTVYPEKLRDYIIGPYILDNFTVPKNYRSSYMGSNDMETSWIDINEFRGKLQVQGEVCPCNEYDSFMEVLDHAEKGERDKANRALKKIKSNKNYFDFKSEKDVSFEYEGYISVKSEFLHLLTYCMFNNGIKNLQLHSDKLMNHIKTDSTLRKKLYDVYKNDTLKGISEAYSALYDYISSKGLQDELEESLAFVRHQVIAFFDMQEYVEHKKQINLVLANKKKVTLNRAMIAVLEEANTKLDINQEKYWPDADARNPIKNYLNHMTRANVENMIFSTLGYLGNDNLVESWFDYTKVHSEICADLGMCHVFGFTPFGYLVFLMNLFIEHLENETTMEDLTVQDGTIEFYFRSRRYSEVIYAISDQDRSVIMKDILKNTSNMINLLLDSLSTGENPLLDMAKDYLYDIKGLKAVLNQLGNISKLDEKEPDESTIYKVNDISEEIQRDLNELGEKLRLFQCQPNTERRRSASAARRDKLSKLLNRLSDYMRYVRVIRQLCRFLIDSQDNDESAVKAERTGEYYRNMWSGMNSVDDENNEHEKGWIEEALGSSMMKVCKDIGRFFNQYHVKFNTVFDFEEQIEFILNCYTDAHTYYRPLYKYMNEPTDEEPASWEEVTKAWFSLLYEKNDNKDKES